MRAGQTRRIDGDVGQEVLREEPHRALELLALDPRRVAELDEQRKRLEHLDRALDGGEVAALVLLVDRREVRRVLHEHPTHPAALPQRVDALEEQLEGTVDHALLRIADSPSRGELVVEVPEVGMERPLVDVMAGEQAVGLHVEGEPRRRAVDPRLRELGTRKAVERRVDLHGVEARGVVAQTRLGRRHALGIPALDHGLVGPRARAQHHVSHGAFLSASG